MPAEFAAVAATRCVRPWPPRGPRWCSPRRAGPSKVAPHALAVLASVKAPADAGEEIAVGRLVLLHDPDGQAAWDGTYRIACFARAELDPEMGARPDAAGGHLVVARGGAAAPRTPVPTRSPAR